MVSFNRSLSIRHLLSGAAVALLTSVTMVSHADLFTFNYTGASPVAITDNTPAGVNLDITVPTNVTLLQSFQSVSLTLTHTWVGDLNATLTHVPTNTTIDLFRRVGVNTGTTVGDSTNLGGTYTFSSILPPTGVNRLIDAAAPLATGVNVPNGTYRPTTNTLVGNGTPTFSGETITNLNTTFDGVANASGIWRLNLSDNAATDLGSITAFSISMNAVPAPSSVAVMALGGLMPMVAIARRRRAAK